MADIKFTPDGRFIFNGIISDEGDLVINSGDFLDDMEIAVTLVDHSVPAYSLSNGLQSKSVVGSLINYQIQITCSNNIDPGNPLPISVNIPSNFTIINIHSDEGSYDAGLGKWIPTLVNQSATLNLILSVTTSGTATQTITVDNYPLNTKTNTCSILSTDTGAMYYTDASITDGETLANLQDGEIYTFLAYSMVSDSGISGIYDGIKNNRIAILNDTTIQLGSRVTEQGAIQEVAVSFIYDSSKTLKLRLYGQYSDVSTAGVDNWYGLTLIEGYSGIIGHPKNLLTNPEAMFDASTTSDIILPAGEESATYTYKIDTIPLSTGTTIFPTGIEINIGCLGGPGEIQVQMRSSSGAISENKSDIFTGSQSNTIVGDSRDIWRLTPNDINQQNIDIEFVIKNTSSSNETITLQNLQFIVYWAVDITRGAPGLIYGGEHSRNYDMLVTNIDNPEGVNVETSTLTLPSTDGILITNQTIKEKDISVKFLIWGDTLEEAQKKLHLIGFWLNNQRNELFIPQTKTLIFDYDSERKYDAIVSDVLTNEIEYNTISAEIKFKIPSGVAFSAEPKITGSIGVNDGKVKVRPIIRVLADGSDFITITDSITGQELTIETTITQNSILTINCEDRAVMDQLGVDYSSFVGIDSVWFGFIGEYDLSCVGGIIQSVEFYEGN